MSEGGRELVLIAGYSGVGKTCLVRELFEPLARRRGYFISGKFDQLQRNTPYSALVTALDELVKQILTESDARLAAWRAKLAAALGPNGQIIVDVIPDVGLIIGPQPPSPPLSPPESQNRFNLVFQRFIRVFHQPEHPLVVFLDDLQWADGATLELLRLATSDEENHHLLLIGAYRDNEIGEAHPLSMTLDALRRQGVLVRTIPLAPLRLDHTAELVADTLGSGVGAALPLAELVQRKTGGNPFFIGQFLGTLYQEGLIRFGAGEGAGERPRWRWDIGRIEELDITDNIVELMLGKLKKLPAGTLDVVRRAACLGGHFDLRTLAVTLEGPAQSVYARLFPAIREGLIVPTSALELLDGESAGAPLVFIHYKFLHDRVQQAAYASMDDHEKPALHLGIGRALRAGAPGPAREERLFEVAHHLNLGRALITAPEERLELCRLDLAAARKAKSAAAYSAALRYLESGMAAFGGDWESQPALTLALNKEMAEALYLNGHYERSEQLIDEIWRKAERAPDRVEAYAQLITHRTMLGRNEEAITAAAAALSLLGMAFPAEDEIEAAASRELAEIEQHLATRTVASLLELPAMTDPEIMAAMKVLMTVHTAVYFADRYHLYRWVLARMTNLSFRYGNVPESAKGYASFGNTLAASLGRHQTGYEFGVLGLRLAQRYGDQGLTCKACLILSMFLNHWVRPVAEAERFDEEGQRAGMESGELQFVGYLMAYGRTINRLHRGEGLAELFAAQQGYLAFCRKVKNNLSTNIVLGARLAIAHLTGDTRTPLSFDAEGLDEAAYLEAARGNRSFAAICFYKTIKALALYLAGEPAAALASVEEARPLLGYIKGVLTESAHNFYHSLILAALDEGAEGGQRSAHRDQIETNQRQMAIWAEHCPANFLHQHLLVEAELARLDGEVERALTLYDRAVAAAKESGVVHHEALANELAAKFWLARGKRDFAGIYLERARLCYRAWGATPKEAACARLAAEISSSSSSEEPGGRREPFTDTTPIESLDLGSVLKASQAISSAIVLDELFDQLLRIVLENAGAQRGSLILRREGRLVAVASISAGDRRAQLAETRVDAAAALPPHIVHYVARTERTVVLRDAALEGVFTADPYVSAARVRSVLCLPILHGGELGGVLYLENNRVAGAFSADRVELLRLLSSQVAISLQNARLLCREQAARAASQEAERRAAFFAETSKLLTESLESEEVLRRLAHLMVRDLACWCLIDVVEDGHIRRVTGEHEDPAKKQILDEVSRRYPPRWDSRHPSARVLRTNEPLLLPEVTDEVLRASCEDDEHLRLIRALGTRTLLSVPLITRGRTLGALTIASEAEGRRYGRTELDLVHEVASRAAIAMENARLYHHVQRSVRTRDEFLMVASHELRSPLTPLKLQNQLIEKHLKGPAFEGLPGREAILGAIGRSLQKIDGLIALCDDLLDISRISAGGLTLHREPLDLSEIVRSAAERHEAACRSAGCELCLSIEAPARGCWDRLRIEQVVTSLLTNAIKYGAGKPIEITVSAEDGRAVLAVRDHGIGIAKGEQAKIFERFERAASVLHYGGFGLGLYLSREIVAAHGGTIRVESEAGRGSTFVVELAMGASGSEEDASEARLDRAIVESE